MKIVRRKDPKKFRYHTEILYESLVRSDVEKEIAKLRKADPDNIWDYFVTDIHTRVLDSYEM